MTVHHTIEISRYSEHKSDMNKTNTYYLVFTSTKIYFAVYKIYFFVNLCQAERAEMPSYADTCAEMPLGL